MALSNSQYEALMRIYNQRQFQNKREQDARIAEVYRRVPQVEALTDEIAADMAQAGRLLLKGDSAGADAMKREAALLKEQKIQYLERNGYPADYMEMKYRCPDCRDTGYRDGKNAAVSVRWRSKFCMTSPILKKCSQERILIRFPWNTMIGRRSTGRRG